MEVELMHARLTVQKKTVSRQGREQLASHQAAQVRVIDSHTSDNYCHLRFAGHLDLVGGFTRQRLAVLHQALHNHLNHFLDVLRASCWVWPHVAAALSHQRRTECVPALAVRLYTILKL